MHVTAIIAAAGAGRRLGGAVPKQLLEVGGRSILQRTIEAFTAHPRVNDVIVALSPVLAAAPPAWMPGPPRVRLVSGGARRQDSVANAVDALRSDTDVVLVHDAARPFVSSDLISRAIDAAAAHGAAIAAVRATDTVKRVSADVEAPLIVETLPRESIYLAQTPQAFRRQVLSDAVRVGRAGADATDEAALAEKAGHPVHVIDGDPRNVKITTMADLDAAREASRTGAATLGKVRAGTGYDLHRIVPGRALVLGGVTIATDRGAEGHSDADAVCHAVTDALLGAACLGDIGRHFPDTVPAWKGASSTALLERAAGMIRGAGFDIANVDATILLEHPKLSPFVEAIRGGLADALDVSVECVSIKAKTNEGLDAVGRGEAIACHAVALLVGR
jgi:2-C-methyl-D-erythritol 4-phosphate cytidylyltransferase/2-C-methyl-D-erythritol 2,4-cyclodiphosphate synthase